MRYTEIIDEMATPAPAMLEQRFYHGTGTTAAATAIMSQGLQGLTTQGRSALAPIKGKVYITADLVYAIIYALGGDFRHAMLESRNEIDGKIDPLGYVFVIEGKDLQDVQPDEDSVGEFLSANSEAHRVPWKNRDGVIAMNPDGQPYTRITHHTCSIGNDDPKGKSIYYFIQNKITKTQYEKIVDGQYHYFAAGGKRVLKTMPDWMKIELINRGAHIAHGGSLRPSECWRITKNRLNELKKDGSNFFLIAERIA